MQKYAINEIFTSIQGEGIDTGKLVTFIRFAGCNLSCPFCDTDYSAKEELSIDEIIERCTGYVVFTGGEPLLRNTRDLVYALYPRIIGVETNGTRPIPEYLEGYKISLSPKVPRTLCEVSHATSLKILYPYLPRVSAWDWRDFPAEYKSIQIIDPEKHTEEGMKEVMNEIKDLGHNWRLGIQIHKFLKGVK